jgi:hypothetical protein
MVRLAGHRSQAAHVKRRFARPHRRVGLKKPFAALPVRAWQYYPMCNALRRIGPYFMAPATRCAPASSRHRIAQRMLWKSVRRRRYLAVGRSLCRQIRLAAGEDRSGSEQDLPPVAPSALTISPKAHPAMPNRRSWRVTVGPLFFARRSGGSPAGRVGSMG